MPTAVTVPATMFMRELRKRDAEIERLKARLALYEAKPVKRGRWFSPIERQVKDA